MREYFTDFSERRTFGQHVSCQAVSKEVRTLVRGFDTRSLQRTLDEVGNRDRTAKSGSRSVVTDEDSPARAWRSVAVQVLCDCSTHIWR